MYMRDTWGERFEQYETGSELLWWDYHTTLYPYLFQHVVSSQHLVANTANSNSPWEMINGRKYDEDYLRHELGQFGIFYENRNPSSKEAPKGDVEM